MKRHLRSALLPAIAALGLVLVAGLWALAAASRGQVRRLPDGAALTLEGETYGKLHPFAHGAWWQKWLYPILPPAARSRSGLWAPRTGWSMGTFISRAPNALVLHAVHRGRPDRSAPFLIAAACGPRGGEFTPGLGSGGSFPLSPGQTQEEWELPVFSRRLASVPVRIYQHVPGDRWLPVAEFVVPNPVPGPYPRWKPSPLPITRRAGDLAVTLTRLTTEVTADPRRHLAPPDAAWTRAGFTITQNGRPAPDWKPIAMTLSDATGNAWAHRNQQRQMLGSRSVLLFSGQLPASEAAWKLRVEFSQTTGFTAGQLWHLAGLPVPRRDQLLDPAATTQRLGAALRLSLAGAGDPFGRGRIWRQPFPAISVTASPSPPGFQLTLLRATDDQGRSIRTFGGVPSSLGGGKLTFLVDQMPPGARTMNLLFAARQNRFAEFLVAPPPAGAPTAPSQRANGTSRKRPATWPPPTGAG